MPVRGVSGTTINMTPHLRVVGPRTMGQQAIHSLTLGSIYALLAAGFTFMYGASRSLYLAYGGLYALGGYVTWWAIRANYTIWLAFSLAVVLCMVVGFIGHLCLRSGSPQVSETSRLLTGLGSLVCLEEVYRLWIGPYRLKVVAIDSHQVHRLGPLMVTDVHWFVLGGTFALFITIHGFLSASRPGRSLDALLRGESMAVSSQASTYRLRGLASGLGAALAGISGVLAGLYLNDVYPSMGTVITHKILALALIGMLGRLQGAILAAFALALTEGILLPATRLPVPSEAPLLVALAIVCMCCPRDLYGTHRPQNGRGL